MTAPGRSGLVFREPLLFESSRPGRRGVPLDPPDVPAVEVARELGAELVRDDIPDFPELAELDVVRHFTRLSQWNYGIDSGFFPLGSCTMKYNPKVNEVVARLPGFAAAHPLADPSATCRAGWRWPASSRPRSPRSRGSTGSPCSRPRARRASSSACA